MARLRIVVEIIFGCDDVEIIPSCDVVGINFDCDAGEIIFDCNVVEINFECDVVERIALASTGSVLTKKYGFDQVKLHLL